MTEQPPLANQGKVPDKTSSDDRGNLEDTENTSAKPGMFGSTGNGDLMVMAGHNPLQDWRHELEKYERSHRVRYHWEGPETQGSPEEEDGNPKPSFQILVPKQSSQTRHGRQGQELLPGRQGDGDGENMAFPLKFWPLLSSHIWQPSPTQNNNNKHNKQHIPFTGENLFVTKEMAEGNSEAFLVSLLEGELPPNNEDTDGVEVFTPRVGRDGGS